MPSFQKLHVDEWSRLYSHEEYPVILTLKTPSVNADSAPFAIVLSKTKPTADGSSPMALNEIERGRSLSLGIGKTPGRAHVNFLKNVFQLAKSVFAYTGKVLPYGTCARFNSSALRA